MSRSTDQGSSSTKSITWELVQEILRECERRDEEASVSEALSAFTVKLVFQDSVYGYKEDEPLSPEDVEDLIETCVDKILNDFSPLMETVRMQTEFLTGYRCRKDVLIERNRSLERSLSSLIRKIVENSSRTKSGKDELYKKIVLLCVLRSGLGDPRDRFVMREAYLAVQSVFPYSELDYFMKKEHKLEKRKHLSELSLIVAGIRIFNWHAKQGTACFDDLPPMLANALDITLKNMDSISSYMETKVSKITRMAECVFYREEKVDERYKKFLRDGLLNYLQYSKYIELLREDAQSLRSRLERYDNKLRRCIDDAEKIITSKPILPKIDVFPKFILLAEIWQCYQEEMLYLSYLNTINQKLHSFTRSVSKSSIMRKVKRVSESHFSDQASKENDTYEEPLIFPLPDGEVRSLKDRFHYSARVVTEELENIDAEFDNGYCPVTLGETGLLLRGNRNLGLLNFEDKYYSCRNYECAERFAKSPETFLLEVKKLLKSQPILLRFLNMTDEEAAIPEKRSAESQTMMNSEDENENAVKSFKDPNYEWNEWEYRRKALLLADRGITTEMACQTEESSL